MVPPPNLYHSLLRPAVLQILRAAGYHSARPSVLDSLTELASRYMFSLCAATARHAAHNDSLVPPLGPDGGLLGGPTVVDVRMALQDLGALALDPEQDELEWAEMQAEWEERELKRRLAQRAQNGSYKNSGNNNHHGEGGGFDEEGYDDEDEYLRDRHEQLQQWRLNENGKRVHETDRGVEDFVAWVTGPRYREIKRVALTSLGEEDATDYLNALKKRHSKTGEDAKYHGTVLGKGNDHGEVLVEGGSEMSIEGWMEKLHGPRAPPVSDDSRNRDPSPTPSSGLSSVPEDLDHVDLL